MSRSTLERHQIPPSAIPQVAGFTARSQRVVYQAQIRKLKSQLGYGDAPVVVTSPEVLGNIDRSALTTAQSIHRTFNQMLQNVLDKLPSDASNADQEQAASDFMDRAHAYNQNTLIPGTSLEAKQMAINDFMNKNGIVAKYKVDPEDSPSPPSEKCQRAIELGEATRPEFDAIPFVGNDHPNCPHLLTPVGVDPDSLPPADAVWDGSDTPWMDDTKSAWRVMRSELIQKYSADQPRAEAGSSAGGEWVSGSAPGNEAGTIREDGSFAHNGTIPGLPKDLVLAPNSRITAMLRSGKYDIHAEPNPSRNTRDGPAYEVHITPRIPAGMTTQVIPPRNPTYDKPVTVDTSIATVQPPDEFGRQAITSTLPTDLKGVDPAGLMWRGGSFDEMKAIMASGGVQSRGDYNVGGAFQASTTSWSRDPAQAGHYAGGFAPSEYKATFEHPSYVMGATMPSDKARYSDLSAVMGPDTKELSIYGQVPVSDVQKLYEVRPMSMSSGSMGIENDGYHAGQYIDTGGKLPDGQYVFREVPTSILTGAKKEYRRKDISPEENAAIHAWYDEHEIGLGKTTAITDGKRIDRINAEEYHNFQYELEFAMEDASLNSHDPHALTLSPGYTLNQWVQENLAAKASDLQAQGFTRQIFQDWGLKMSGTYSQKASIAAINQAVSDKFNLSNGTAQSLVDGAKSGDAQDWAIRLPAARAMVDKVYADTQQYYKDHPDLTDGQGNVTLFRGLLVPPGHPDPFASLPFTGDISRVSARGEYLAADLVQNPVKSWTNNSGEAINYAKSDNPMYSSPQNDSQGYVLAAKIPVERILSIPMTGPGWASAGEHIVIGGPMNVGVGRVHWSSYKP